MRKVSDLTVEEFEQLLEEVVERKLEEFLRDSDEGLELTEWIKKQLQESMAAWEAGERGVPLTNLCAKCAKNGVGGQSEKVGSATNAYMKGGAKNARCNLALCRFSGFLKPLVRPAAKTPSFGRQNCTRFRPSHSRWQKVSAFGLGGQSGAAQLLRPLVT